MDEPAIFSVQEAVSLIWLNSVFAGQSRRNTAYTNVLCVITESKYDRYLRRVIGKTSFSEFGRYALVPNYSAPRWIIPLGNRRVGSASLRLYNPQSLRGKIFKQIVSNLAHLGVQRVWGRDRLVVVSKGSGNDASLATFLQELLEVRDLYLAFSTGTPGYYRKTTAQVMSGDGRTLAYAKIAYTPQAKRLLMQEAETLSHLAESHISTERVPQVLYTGQFHESELLVQSAPSRKTRTGPGRLDIRHIEFLAEIFNQTSIQETVLESEYWNRLKKDVTALQEQVSSDWQRRLQYGLDICESLLVGKMMPLGLCHRDFVPWNTCCERKRLYVFDWEYAIKQGIPFWDIVHFTSFPAMLIHRSSGKEVINLWRGTKSRELLVLYADKIGVDVSLVPICFLLYLTDLCCFYLNMFTRDGLWDKQRQRLRKIWAEMFDELTTNWEIYWMQWQ